MDSPDAWLSTRFRAHREVLERLEETRGESILELARAVESVARKGNTVYLCGNGGSAADAQHLAAELVGRFRHDRSGLRAVALTVDTSCLTALANDFGYDAVFERQIETHGRPGDLLIGISTSGTSRNVLRALRSARESGLATAALTGNDGGDLVACADVAVIVPDDDTARIQEAHVFVGHLVCDFVESRIFDGADVGSGR